MMTAIGFENASNLDRRPSLLRHSHGEKVRDSYRVG